MNVVTIEYSISAWSSYSATYLPENIRENDPRNQTSRWSSNTNSPPQFLTLKLKKPAIIKNIKFGKYEKSHVCNLKKFRVEGGLDDKNLIPLFEGGLRNDNQVETFEIKHTTGAGEVFPVLYLRLIPLLSWGPSFNFSIWYVELLGNDDELFVLNSLRRYNMAREVEIVRLTLKHLRQRGYENAFRALEFETKIKLEDTMITEIHLSLVGNGDYQRTEQLIENFIDNGFIDEYIEKQTYKPSWTELQGCSPVETTPQVATATRPGKRGGHQLVFDSNNRVIYLYGGFDSLQDMSDMWRYPIDTGVWELIHENSDEKNGPSGRACHKMIFDPVSNQIFMLGYYCTPSNGRDTVKSDFWLYDIKNANWLRICEDTSQENGPKLVYDHQMCIDIAKSTLYVFGGKVIQQRSSEESSGTEYSGLYSYHIPTNTWNLLLVDCGHPSAANPDVNSIKSRGAHSMIFDSKNRKIYIFGGQRMTEYLTDFLQYDVDSNELTTIAASNNGFQLSEVTMEPNKTGFTQRAAFDDEKGEIYVLSSLSKDKERRDFNINALWMYSLRTNEWSCIYKSLNQPSKEFLVADKIPAASKEPCPRYAHQFIYDKASKMFYLFGGNPGSNSVRLDDFWKFQLTKPTRNHVLNYCKYLIRKQEYEEICKVDTIKAVYYLQTKLSETINKSDQIQVQEFHKLASLLFRTQMSTEDLTEEVQPSDCVSPDAMDDELSTSVSSISSIVPCASDSKYHNLNLNSDKDQKIRTQRGLLFNKLIELLPEEICQPRGNLVDSVII